MDIMRKDNKHLLLAFLEFVLALVSFWGNYMVATHVPAVTGMLFYSSLSVFVPFLFSLVATFLVLSLLFLSQSRLLDSTFFSRGSVFCLILSLILLSIGFTLSLAFIVLPVSPLWFPLFISTFTFASFMSTVCFSLYNFVSYFNTRSNKTSIPDELQPLNSASEQESKSEQKLEHIVILDSAQVKKALYDTNLTVVETSQLSPREIKIPAGKKRIFHTVSDNNKNLAAIILQGKMYVGDLESIYTPISAYICEMTP